MLQQHHKINVVEKVSKKYKESQTCVPSVMMI
jgi:hypothetical protein